MNGSEPTRYGADEAGTEFSDCMVLASPEEPGLASSCFFFCCCILVEPSHLIVASGGGSGTILGHSDAERELELVVCGGSRSASVQLLSCSQAHRRRVFQELGTLRLSPHTT